MRVYLEYTENYISETFPNKVKLTSEPRLWKWVTSREGETAVEGEQTNFPLLYVCRLVLLKMVV
jgi:hypothetical protein